VGEDFRKDRPIGKFSQLTLSSECLQSPESA